MKAPLETSLAYKYFIAYRLYDGQRFDEIVIPYHPRKSFEKKFRNILSHGRKLEVFLMGLALTLCLTTHSTLPFLMLVGAFAAIWIWIQFYTSVKPTHIGFSDKGARLYWIRWFGDKKTPFISWSDVAAVRLRKQRELFYDETWIDLVSAQNTKESLLSFRLDGINVGEHRKRLHTALCQHVTGGFVDHSLHDTLNPVKIDSYTTLWLEVLAASTTRVRDNTLPGNSSLANGRYEIVKQLGIGGQGVAYLAKAHFGAFGENTPEMDVVLKEFVLPYHAGLNVSKKALENIQRECELLKKLAHPKIVRVVDLFVEDQRAYMVLEHIDGESLHNIVGQRGKLPENEVLHLALQMCEILSHLHSQSPPVLHRDFTPENMILATDGYLRLIDFNVAQQQESTATRTVVGKHAYIPPEQFRGKATTQSDIYAMGASLYYLLIGEEPEPIMTAHPRNVDDKISATIDGIVAKATATDTELRYTTIEDLHRDLLALKKTAVTP